MPTGARLFGALAFAVIAFLASEIFKPLLPEGTQVGMLSPINAGLGLLCGWLVMGPNTGRGYYAAAGNGIRTSLTFLFYALIGWAIYEMLIDSTRPQTYDGPMAAINGAFRLMYDYLVMLGLDKRTTFTLGAYELWVPQVLLVLFGGGIFGGWLAEWANDRMT